MSTSARAADARPLICVEALPDDPDPIDLTRLLPAWIISGTVHALCMALLLVVNLKPSHGYWDSSISVLSQVDDDGSKDADLENTDLGDVPGIPTTYPVDRLGEESMPGLVDPSDPVGLEGSQDQVPKTVQPPPGYENGSGSALNDPNRFGSGQILGSPGGLNGHHNIGGGPAGRSGITKDRLIQQGGGNPRSEAAVAAGLFWVARHQAADGHWSLHAFCDPAKCNCGNVGAHNDLAATGLALLPLLAGGQTHKGTGAQHRHAKNVERGLRWLITQQGADGALGDGYAHPICTIALCEAYGMTADPELRGPAQRAINCCVAWQHANGGFRYQPRTPGDLSVSGWFVQALKSGYLAGLRVPNATLNNTINYLDSVANADGSGYGYQQPQPAPTMTAVGLLCRQYLGWGPRNAGLIKGCEYLQKLPPSRNFKNIYYYYYATQVMYHMSATNPDAWQQWNERMRDMLVDTQDQGASPDRRDQKGSWSPEGDAWGGQLGRLGYTALTLLTLEVYYRHLPLYKRELGAMKDLAKRDVE